MSLAGNIRTFTERVEEAEQQNAIRDTIRQAQTIVFLGFAFHPLNLKLIDPGGERKAVRVFATRKGVSEHEEDTLRRQIRPLTNLTVSQSGNINFHDATCGEMLAARRLSLMAV